MKKQAIIILLSGILVIACQNRQDSGDSLLNRHFDLKAYAEGFPDDLRKAEKTVIWNGEKEIQSFDQYNLKKDLRVFAGYGLPNLGVEEKYQIDTIFLENQRVVRYRADDDQQVLKELDIFYQNDQVDSLQLERFHSTFIAKQRIQLTLRNDGTYDFMNARQNLGIKDSSIVQLRFR